MARWRLTQPHYLLALTDGEPTQWEYKEVSRNTGKAMRKMFTVPRYLDTRDGSPDFNYPGEVIVAYDTPTAQRQDILFTGKPTPDMEPLDEEAEVISKAESPNWKHPIDTLPGDYGASMIANFERQITDLLKNKPASEVASPVSAGSVSAEDFARLRDQVAELMAQNAELKAKAETSSKRRVA